MNRKLLSHGVICLLVMLGLLGCAAPSAAPAAPTAPTAAPAATRAAVAATAPNPTSTAAAVSQKPKELKKVVVSVGSSTLNVAYPYLTVAKAMGYWEEEGLDVRIMTADASLSELQQMVGGKVDFVAINSSTVVQANATENIPVRIVTLNVAMDWGLVVLEDGPYKDVKDLKGKPIGVLSLASGGIPYLKSYFHNSGMDPETDLRMLTVGYGAPALDALNTGKVVGLMLWGTALAALENQGAELRYFRDATWPGQPDYAVATLQSTIDRDPQMVEGIARGVAKASVFTAASPECMVKVHWANWPESKPTGAADDVVFQWDLHIVKSILNSMNNAYSANGSKYWGAASIESYAKLQSFLKEAKLIEREVDPASLVINLPDFHQKINNFDVAAIQAQAKNCPVK